MTKKKETTTNLTLSQADIDHLLIEYSLNEIENAIECAPVRDILRGLPPGATMRWAEDQLALLELRITKMHPVGMGHPQTSGKQGSGAIRGVAMRKVENGYNLSVDRFLNANEAKAAGMVKGDPPSDTQVACSVVDNYVGVIAEYVFNSKDDMTAFVAKLDW